MTSLVILLVMSMVVLAALRSGLLEERMAANASNRQLALQAAESVTRSAEISQFTGAGFFSNFSSVKDNLDPGFYWLPGAPQPLTWETVVWSDETATLTGGANLSVVDKQPGYIVEIIEKPQRRRGGGCYPGLLGVTSRGVGKDSAAVLVRAIYRYQSDKLVDSCGFKK